MLAVSCSQEDNLSLNDITLIISLLKRLNFINFQKCRGFFLSAVSAY